MLLARIDIIVKIGFFLLSGEIFPVSVNDVTVSAIDPSHFQEDPLA